MTHIFDDDKYQEAAQKCLEFIKRQLNVNNFTYIVSFAEEYGSYYEGDVMWGNVQGLSRDEDQVFPQYIGVDEYYDYGYTGQASGNGPDGGAVKVYVLRDNVYEVMSCPVRNGRWITEQTYKETYLVPDEVIIEVDEETGETIETPVTYTVGETTEDGGTITEVGITGEDGKTYHRVEVEYVLPVNLGEGVKVFKYCTGYTEYWEDVSVPGAQYEKAERLVYVGTGEVSDEDGGNAYPYFTAFYVRMYTYSDTEYLNDNCKIFRVSGDESIWYTNHVANGQKIAKMVQQYWSEGEFKYEVVAISGAVANITNGRLPASFLIPPDDPQYDKDGSKAQWKYAYCANSRSWVYDIGIALMVFVTSGDYDICREIMNRMSYEQNSDGSFNFSYDIYIGQLFEGYVRTGSMGWVVWGMCYYTLETGDRSYVDMIKKAGDWMVGRQITDTDDPRYGLMTGGYGSYNFDDYSYIDVEIEWCSVEHQCSGLQALEGCALVLKNSKYKEAAELVRDNLYLHCYDKENGRFYQGINGGVPDSAWALDCTTWAGSMAFSIVADDCAKDCCDTAKDVYLTKNKTIEVSSEKEHYNMTYSLDGTLDGFKPYSDRTSDYEGAPDLVWSEGTFGYVLLCLRLGKMDEARYYMDEMIKLQNCNNCTGGVLYTTATYASLPWEFHSWESCIGAAWMYLLIKNPDVLFPVTMRQVYYMAKILNIQDERP